MSSEASRGSDRIVALRYPEAEHEMTTLVYQGQHHEFCTTQPGKVSLDLFDAFLKHLSISETTDGIALRPKPGGGATVSLQVGVGFVPDVTAITVHVRVDRARDLPLGQGLKVRGGELWGLADENEGLAGRSTGSTRGVLLANGATAAELTPVASAGESFRLLAEEIRIEHRAA